jgi:hypothetical protein
MSSTTNHRQPLAKPVDHCLGRAEVRQQKSCVDAVEAALRQAAMRVAGTELDLRQALLPRLGAREFELDGVDVDADHLPCRADTPREVEADVATPTADIEPSRAAAHADAVEQRSRRRCHHARQQPQAFAPIAAAADGVPAGAAGVAFDDVRYLHGWFLRADAQPHCAGGAEPPS